MRKTLLVCLTVAILVVSSALFPTFVSAAEANVSPASLSFGQITVNTQSSFLTMHVYNENRHTILISRIYSTAPEFLVKSPSLPLELAPHATASFEVAFAPNSASSFSGNVIVSVQGRNGSTYSVSVPIAGTGKAVSTTTPSVLTGSASSLSFGSALVGASASQTLTLANSGTAPIAITGMTASGSGFAYSNFSATETLLAGQSIYVTVTFTPTVVGNVTGSLNIVSNASNPSVAIPLTGIGIQPQISVTPASISFGNVSVGVADTQSLTIKNTGTANLIVSSASLAGSSFSLSGMTTPMTLAPGASSTITVGFKPVSASSFYANLSLSSNSPSSPLVVPLSGTSVASILQLSASPTSMNFGSLITGTSSTQSVTVTNTGNSSVAVSNIAMSGTGFSHTTVALPVSLAAGQSTSFGIEFAPTSAGNLTGTATVTSTATNSPLTITLTGTGASAATYSVALNWAAGSTAAVGFNLYRGTTSGGPYSKMNSGMLTTTAYSDTNVTAGQTYYYVATEENSAGQESIYSNQVALSIP